MVLKSSYFTEKFVCHLVSLQFAMAFTQALFDLYDTFKYPLGLSEVHRDTETWKNAKSHLLKLAKTPEHLTQILELIQLLRRRYIGWKVVCIWKSCTKARLARVYFRIWKSKTNFARQDSNIDVMTPKLEKVLKSELDMIDLTMSSPDDDSGESSAEEKPSGKSFSSSSSDSDEPTRWQKYNAGPWTLANHNFIDRDTSEDYVNDRMSEGSLSDVSDIDWNINEDEVDDIKQDYIQSFHNSIDESDLEYLPWIQPLLELHFAEQKNKETNIKKEK